MIQTLAEVIIAALLVLGGLFGLIGSYGLLRLRGAVQRLHAPTKASTLGVGAVLLAGALQSSLLLGVLSWHQVLVTLFIFLTAPLTALYLAKTLLHRHIDPADLPATETGAPWAGQDVQNDGW
jgi:multicomponent K+:H+ antiporter subunit G